MANLRAVKTAIGLNGVIFSNSDNGLSESTERVCTPPILLICLPNFKSMPFYQVTYMAT